jgi:hypothetical protein
MSKITEVLKSRSDNAYCDFIAQMKRDECLGPEEKIRIGKFGNEELRAHCAGHNLLGRHQAFTEALVLISKYEAGEKIAYNSLRVAQAFANVLIESIDHEIKGGDPSWREEAATHLAAALRALDPPAPEVPVVDWTKEDWESTKRSFPL